jgi:biopolymer transport protein ExbB
MLKFAYRSLPALAVLTFANLASAQTGQQAAAQQVSPLADFFGNMGPIGYVLLLLSVIALALVIESFMSLKRDKFAPPDVIDELEALFEEGNFQEALDLCENQRTYLTNVVASGLGKLGHSFEVIRGALREMQEEESVKLFQKVGWMSIIAATAPLLGLLGTMLGMFFVFGAIAQAQGSVQPAQLAFGIKMKLITTIMGLCIAIPMSLFFFLFRNKVMRASIEVNAISEELFERFRKEEVAAKAAK